MFVESRSFAHRPNEHDLSLCIFHNFFLLSIRFACSKPLLWDTVKSFFASSDGHWHLASTRFRIRCSVTSPRDILLYSSSWFARVLLRVKINENDFSCTNFHGGSLNVRPSTRSVREITNFSALWTAIAAGVTTNIYALRNGKLLHSVLCRGRQWLGRGHLRTIWYCFGRQTKGVIAKIAAHMYKMNADCWFKANGVMKNEVRIMWTRNRFPIDWIMPHFNSLGECVA